MTHYLKHYDTSNPTLADMQALQDMRDYLGEERWALLGQGIYQPGATMRETGYTAKKELIQQFRLACCLMLGVEGRPVRAYLRMIWRAHS